MKLRIEFYRSSSSYFAAALQLCRNYSTFAETGEGAAKKYSVEFDNYTEEFCRIMRLCSSWRGSFFYMNNKPVRPYQIHRYFGDTEYRMKNRLLYCTGDDILNEIKKENKNNA